MPGSDQVEHSFKRLKVDDRRSRREQLSLFSPAEASPIPSVSLICKEKSTLAERLASLLREELDFHAENSTYGSHALHAFAAKFPPQLPGLFIRALTRPGDVVLDPMLGSGTAVVEAVREGRVGVGLDIDPLALRLSRAKTQPLDLDLTRQLGQRVLRRATEFLADQIGMEQHLASAFDEKTRRFVDYWFLEHTQRELLALALAIREIDDLAQRRFLELIFSSTIITKSGGVSMARDLAHTRPHLDKNKVPRSALDEYVQRLNRSIRGMAELAQTNIPALIIAGDARAMPLASESVHLVVTSPPYANAIDYMRAHKFSLVWLGESLNSLSGLRARYIGSEQLGPAPSEELPSFSQGIVCRLEKIDAKKAKILRKYYVDMLLSIREMFRVLKHNSAAVIVVGTSTMRGLNVETHTCLAELGVAAGFKLIGITERRLDRNRRMMPARFGQQTDSVIEKRMHVEYVIGLYKE
jgi:DNA modification methylase